MSVTFASIDWCTTCRRDRRFEQPVCAEGHGRDCPESFCLDCGTAVVLAASSPEPVRARRSAA